MPQNFYELVWIFIIYAFIGWCTEVSYAALDRGIFVNRGFLNGPYCPIYGCGVVIVVAALTPLKDNLLILFAGSLLLTSILEYITGFILEKVFHNKWWDYSNKPFNLHGYICLKFSIYWGLACTFIMDVIHPIIYKGITMIPHILGVVLLCIIMSAFAVDCGVTVTTILKFNKRLKVMDEMAAKIHKLSDEIGENIYENVTTAVEKSEEFQETHEELLTKISDTKENLIHDVKAENNTDNDTTTYVHDSDTLVNQKLDYIALKKIWDDHDNAAKIRPDVVTIKATHKTTKEVKVYTLTKDNNWTMFTDIKKDDREKWEFREDVPEGYTLTSTHWNDAMYVISFTNFHENPEYVDINVQKVWEDGDNGDDLRPISIKAQLYRNGEKYKNAITLDETNNWSDDVTYHCLDKYDKAGEPFEYEVKEEVYDKLTGNAKTGYVDTYETNETIDDDGTTTKNIMITNTHTPDTTKKKVKKVWNDHGNKDGIRPKSVLVNLLADGKVEETLMLSAKNNWKASSKVLPVKVNGKKVNYTWKEVEEGLITGESEIGYRPTYDTDENDQDLTVITNTHDRTGPKGSITITKALDPGNLNMDVGDPTFIFTLTGTDVYGKKHSYEKKVKFTKAEVEKQMKDHPGDLIELSVTFDDLEYGTYTCNEGGMIKYFKLLNITSNSSNATIDQEKETVTFDIGPTGTTAKAQLTGGAKFMNQMIQGSVKLIKKDSKGKSLRDIEFVITSSDGAEVAKAKTDSAGEVTFDGLLPDTYTITETKTAVGKNLLKEPIIVTLPMTMSQAEVDKQNTSKAIKQGNDYYFYHLTYNVTNDSILNLPKTGGRTDELSFIGGIILILGGLFLLHRKFR